MTCIIGIVDKKLKNVVMGADSAGSAGNSLSIRKDVKIFKNGDFIIGCTSSYRMIQLLRFSFSPPEMKRKDIYEYMCTDFINGVRMCFKNGGFLQKYQEGDEQGGTFLVAYKDRLFKIENDFQVGETFNGMNAVGCGEEYALGALHILNKEPISAVLKIRRALEVSEFYVNGVQKPFIILST
jgi:ATP-dependent protease HslVU (ClpYQ) peptidase subunit